MPRRAPLLPLVLGLGLVVALGAASIRTVPAGSRGVLTLAGRPRLVEPGRHLAPPGLARLNLYPAGPAEMAFPAPADTAEGRWRAFTAEGAPLELSLTVRYELPAERLVEFDRAAGGDAATLLSPILRTELRQVAAKRRWDQSAAGSASLLGSELALACARPFEAAGARLVSVQVERLGLAAGGSAVLQAGHAAGTGRKVLLLGIDAADWTILDRLRARGELPHLSRLIREGASGPLRSIEPLLSPLIWTTIATGVGPERHRILDFLVTDPATGKQVPATSRLRAAPAVWNIAPAYGRRAGIVGWLATWPAEPIDGFIVSDRFGFLAFAGEADEATQDVVHPPGLLDGRPSLAVPSSRIDADAIRRFLDVPAADIEAARRAGFEKGNDINNFIHTLAAAESYGAIGLDLYRSRRPDLMAVYFEFIDAVGHLFMPFEPPARPGVSEADVRRFGGAVSAAYRHQDELIGRFLEAADDSTIVVIVSDHGFRSGEARLAGGAGMEEANAARWHLPDGVLILAGPGVRAGARIERARIFDIAPTLLALLGCPASTEMSGRVLAEAFRPGYFSAADTTRIDQPLVVGWAPPETGSGGRTEVNLGIVLAKEGRLAEAEAAFKKALAREPGDRVAVNNLASLYMRQERHAEAFPLLEELLRRDPGYATGWGNLAICDQRLGRPEAALGHFDRALELEPSDQRTRANRGFLLLDLDRPADAERDFRAALGIDARQPNARFGLGAALAGQGRTAEAIAELEAALAEHPGHERAKALLRQLRGNG